MTPTNNVWDLLDNFVWLRNVHFNWIRLKKEIKKFKLFKLNKKFKNLPSRHELEHGMEPSFLRCKALGHV